MSGRAERTAGGLRVGVVGGGFVAEAVHLPALLALPEVERVAVCDHSRERASGLLATYGLASAYTHYLEMLEAEELDAVIVAVPNRLHRPVTLAALERGVPVLCEKPLALDVGEAREMCDAAARLGLPNAVNFTYRFVPAVRRVKELIEEGFVGQPLFVNVQWFQQLYVDPDLPAVWRLTREHAGTGVLGDLGSHVMDLLSWWLGPLCRVAGSMQTYPPERSAADGGRVKIELDTTCSFLADLAGGVSASCQVSQTAACRANYQHIEIYGSEGCLVYELEWSGPAWMLGQLRGGRRDGLLEPIEIPARLTAELGPLPRTPISDFLPNRANCTRAFISAVRGGEPGAPTFLDGLRAQCAVDAVAQAVRERGWVEVPAVGSSRPAAC